MDPINIIVLLNIILVFAANIPSAKKGLVKSLSVYREKPVSFLQKTPVVITTVIIFILLLGVFKVGTIDYKEQYFTIRLVGLGLYIIFSWTQIAAFKKLGEFYSQDVALFKNHKIITSGIYKYIRHPQYLSQILLDIGACMAVLSYILVPLVLIEIPLFIMRASLEEKMFEKHFEKEYLEYKKHSGFFIPFLG